ncbi:MAG: putative DNA binding domain-containing protein [Bacteroidales bacterium]|nr:putative DNA binding domain-containing protein [Bacteroidales bacterium]
MDSNQLSEILKNGENSRVQFKERLDNQDSIAAELIAFSNSKGGLLVFGVNDKTGEAIGLNYIQIQDYGNKIGTIANELIKPQVFITTEVVDICGKSLLVVDVAEGIAKPYKDRNGTIWIKQGADKRRLTDNNEQIRLFQQSGLIYIDEMKVPYTGIEDIDTEKVKKYLVAVSDEDEPITPTLLKNINVTKENLLTLGGLLFFGKNPQKYRPAFCIKAVSFFGNELGGSDYRDSEDIVGTIPEMFQKSISFFTRNLHHIQAGQSFNSTGLLEISPVVLEELLQNALTHRDYSKNAPIRICIFDNRVEIISPGKLPNSLTVENIKRGNAVVRNNLIVSYSTKLMRYRGFGSGIVRALKEQPDISFINDVDGEQFTVIIPRKQQ